MKALCLAFIAVAASACASTPRRGDYAAAASAAALVDLAIVPQNFVWRQAINAQYASPEGETRSGRFEAVLQKQGNTLTLVGLTPLGTRAFVAVQEGVDVKVVEGDESRLPFPPRFVFLDINRCFFLGSNQPQTDGWHEYEAVGEEVRDLWKSGLLVQRSLRRPGDAPGKHITISYDKGLAPGQQPPEVQLNNARLGYQLTIRTLEAQQL